MDWGLARRWALGPSTLLFVACSGLNHDCVERRDCAAPEAIIEAGPRDEWWESGGAGPSESPRSIEPGGAGSGLVGASEEVAGGAGSVESAGSAGAADSPLDPPGIAALSPADGERGLSSDVRIVIAFTQAMDPRATEAAYRSSDLPSAALMFSWDQEQRLLTLTPRTPLAYGSEAVSLTYHYGFDGTARDQQGQALPAVEFSFRTLRQVALELSPDSELTGNWTDIQGEGIHNCLRHPPAPYQPTVCVGDDLHGARYWGFLSFDLSPIPDQATHILSARLLALATVYGAPDALGKNSVEHVAFNALGEAAMNAAPRALLGPFFNGVNAPSGSQVALDVDLSTALAEDYEDRSALQRRSQYRIGFANGSANSHWDDLELPTSDIRLAVSYLIP